MNHINFPEEGFCIVFLALWSMGLLASGIWFSILGILARRELNGRQHAWIAVARASKPK
jgi:hypothetical protein